MKSPKVTVLMPVYNSEKYLHEAVESILNQTFTDFEFIIVHDPSTDKTAEILQSFHDPRIKIINNEKVLGLIESLNKGLRMARGRYIARMDADDVSYPSRLEVQHEYMEKNPDVGIVGSWNDIIDDACNTIDFGKCNYTSEDIYYILNFRNCLTHCSIIFRKELIINNGGYNETAIDAEDYELWNRISKVARIHQIHEPLVKWRQTNDSISAKNSSSQKETVNKVVNANLERLMDDKEDVRTIRFFPDRFDNCNYLYPDFLTRDELLDSIKLANELNRRIIDDAPRSLNKEDIKVIAENMLINYIYAVCLKISWVHLARCVNKFVRGNIWQKTKIMARMTYRKLGCTIYSRALTYLTAH